MNRLSKRLSAIVDMVPDEAVTQTVADVGTDHGFVPIRLLLDRRIARAIAMDIRPGPLSRAREHIEQEGLSDVAEVRLSDGLSALREGEAQGVVMAGMGGELMLRILDEGGKVREGIRWWVFSPQSELSRFRHGLEEMGLGIVRETMLEEDGKYYTVMLAVPGRMHYESEADYRYGALLIDNASPVLREFLKKEEKRINTALRALSSSDKEAASQRYAALEKEKKEIETVYDRMQ